MVKTDKSKISEIEYLTKEVSGLTKKVSGHIEENKELDKELNENFSAVIEGLIKVREELEKINNKVARPEEKAQDYTIFEAAEENKVELIQKLVRDGVDVNSTDEQGNTAL